jgi:hypothetical protein
MIQLVPGSYDYDSGVYKAPCYKVHDMMLELILKKCRENNFIRLAQSYQQEGKAELQVKVRRLVVHINDAKDDIIIGRHLSQLRSLSLFGATCVPPLSELRFIRVLFLLTGFPRHQAERVDLTRVSQLSQLRYLKVDSGTRGNIEVVLPSQIRSMQHLERLEVQESMIRSIPTDIVDLPCLSHLIITTLWMTLPDGICKVKSLRVLRHFRLPADSSHIIDGLGELTNLAELSLDCKYRPEGGSRKALAAWSSSLNKLSNLTVLRVYSYPYSCCADALSSWVSPPFPFLEELHVLGWTFSRIPRWIGGLHNLHSLHFGVKEVSNFSCRDDVGLIGMLPNLILLNLRIEGDVPPEGIVISGSAGFKRLELFYLEVRSTSGLAFEAGAMPNLRKMALAFDQRESDRATVPVGLEHLGGLRTITIIGARVGGDDTDTYEDRFHAFIEMFREAIKGLPSQPTFDSMDNHGMFRYRSFHRICFRFLVKPFSERCCLCSRMVHTV